jgi:hypothetical protein
VYSFLGANTPTASTLANALRGPLADRQVDVLANSAPITFHVSTVAELITSVRASDVGKDVRF